MQAIGGIIAFAIAVALLLLILVIAVGIASIPFGYGERTAIELSGIYHKESAVFWAAVIVSIIFAIWSMKKCGWFADLKSEAPLLLGGLIAYCFVGFVFICVPWQFLPWVLLFCLLPTLLIYAIWGDCGLEGYRMHATIVCLVAGILFLAGYCRAAFGYQLADIPTQWIKIFQGMLYYPIELGASTKKVYDSRTLTLGMPLLIAIGIGSAIGSWLLAWGHIHLTDGSFTHMHLSYSFRSKSIWVRLYFYLLYGVTSVLVTSIVLTAVLAPCNAIAVMLFYGVALATLLGFNARGFSLNAEFKTEWVLVGLLVIASCFYVGFFQLV